MRYPVNDPAFSNRDLAHGLQYKQESSAINHFQTLDDGFLNKYYQVYAGTLSRNLKVNAY